MQASLGRSGPVQEASIVLLPRELGIKAAGPATREPAPLPRHDAHVRVPEGLRPHYAGGRGG